MNDEQKMLKRDIDTLKEAINLDWADLASLPLTAQETAGIREHIRLCTEDLKKLRERRERMEGKNSN